MRKIIPYILILLIFVNLFAPFSVGVKNNQPIIIKSEVEAGKGVTMQATAKSTDTTISATISVSWEKAILGQEKYVLAQIKDSTGKILKLTDASGNSQDAQMATLTDDPNQQPNSDYLTQTGEVVFTGLTPDTQYSITIKAVYISGLWSDYIFPGVNLLWTSTDDRISSVDLGKELVAKTNTAGQKDYTFQDKQSGANLESRMPSCGIVPGPWSNGTIYGCAAQLIYYVLFLPTSYLFALTGQFFDGTFNYSVQSSSYRTPFVVQGWGIIRDLCNMFFIFVLLYIAFSTILNIHGANTKQKIINVIIIGILINFSLFTTHLIIDASNVLARVFYNSDAIKITKSGANGVTDATSSLGPNGELPLSAAIVNKINPQNLIINGSNSVVIQDNIAKESGSAATSGNAKVGVGAFILITLLATIVNIVGMIVFLSVGLIFVSRVIGLWLAMVFAPLAFFTYTVPEMKNFTMVGWSKWWPETLKLAFLAPVFIFFIYLILKFLEPGLSIFAAGEATTGTTFVLSIIIPFVFVMLLMWQAKNIAKEMSGQIGQSITGGVAAIGGLALGGAALGAAALGRGTIGSFMKGASTGDTAARRLANNDPTLSRFGRMKGRLQQISGVDWAQQRVGGRLNRDQGRVEGYAHARKTLDDTAQARYHKKYSELTQTERTTIHDTIDNNIVSRQLHGNRAYNQLTDPEQTAVRTAVAAQRATPGGVNHGAAHLVDESRGKQGLASKIIQSTRNGSFDARNLSKVVANEYDRGFSKIVTGITSGLASGMRNAFKQSGVNYGTGQKDFFKDMGHTITEALKSASVKVDLSHVGEEHKEDGGHGGGGHH